MQMQGGKDVVKCESSFLLFCMALFIQHVTVVCKNKVTFIVRDFSFHYCIHSVPRLYCIFESGSKTQIVQTYFLEVTAWSMLCQQLFMPSATCRHHRMRVALLMNYEMVVSQISDTCGYSDVMHMPTFPSKRDKIWTIEQFRVFS